MTPKEKAEELFKKYSSIKIKEVYDGIFLSFADDLCKQCALIAADEVLKRFNHPDEAYLMKHSVNYWTEVKKEIEKL